MKGRQRSRRRKRPNDKANAQRRHARQRFAERHQLDVSKRDLELMVRMIQGGRSTPVRATSRRVTVHDLVFEGRTRRVVYDRQRKTIVTVLPIPGEVPAAACGNESEGVTSRTEQLDDAR